jgi:SEC-C motif
MPGEKASVSIYLPIKPAELCPCGSGLRFRACCRRKRYWLAVCRDPGIHGGYSLVSPQTATFSPVDGDVLAPQLMDDVRLHCVENTRRRAFWINWGDPALDDAYGTWCFGDIELKNARTLVVSAMSDRRMAILLALLHEQAGVSLGLPRFAHTPVQPVAKPKR